METRRDQFLSSSSPIPAATSVRLAAKSSGTVMRRQTTNTVSAERVFQSASIEEMYEFRAGLKAVESKPPTSNIVDSNNDPSPNNPNPMFKIPKMVMETGRSRIIVIQESCRSRNPFQVTFRSRLDGQHHKLRRVVGMLSQNQFFQRGQAAAGGFENNQHLRAALH